MYILFVILYIFGSLRWASKTLLHRLKILLNMYIGLTAKPINHAKKIRAQELTLSWRVSAAQPLQASSFPSWPVDSKTGSSSLAPSFSLRNRIFQFSIFVLVCLHHDFHYSSSWAFSKVASSPRKTLATEWIIVGSCQSTRVRLFSEVGHSDGSINGKN